MRRILFGLATLTTSLVGGPATAAIFTYVVTGTVVGGGNEGNATFGDDVIGRAFSASFEVDDALPTALYAASATGSSAQGGGLVQPGTRPPVTATLTINGISYAIRTGERKQEPTCYPEIGECFGSTWTEDDRGGIVKDADARQLSLFGGYRSFDNSPGLFFRNMADALDFTLRSADFTVPDYRQPGSYAVTGTGSFATSYDLVAYSGGSEYSATRLSLAPTRLSVGGGVPEPATWAMMILGFGLIGAAMRGQAGPVAARA